MLKFQKKISFGLQIYERKLRTFDLSKKVLFVHFIIIIILLLFLEF